MPSYAEINALVEKIRDARPEALDPIVTGWRSAATTAASLTARAATVDRDTATVFTNNGNEIYDAAVNTARTRTALGDSGEHYDRIGRAVGVVREELATTKTGVLTAWDQLTAELNAVSDASDRLARAAHAMTQPQVDAQAAALQTRADHALATHGATITRLLGSYDNVLNNRRGVLADLGFTGHPTASPASTAALLPPGGTPAQISAAWDALTPRQQADLLDTDPALLGNLDGIPATIRDLAIRDRLPGEITRLDGEIATAKAALDNGLQNAEPLPAGMEGQGETRDQLRLRDRLEQLQGQRDALTGIQQSIAGPDKQLLLLDVSGHAAPRAAVAVGNIDTADHVAVFTPGFTTTVADGLPGYTGDMVGLRNTALKQLDDVHRGDQTVAAVTWVGYDVPQWSTVAEPDRSVLLPIDAQHAGVDLARFYDGINASRASDPHLTAVGHSYGSTTTGYALQHTTTPVGDAVVFGSPGLGTDDVKDLRVPAGHTAAIRAYADPVASFGVFGDKVSTMDGVTGLSANEQTLPDGPALNGVTGHSAYLEPGSTSQYNIAATVAGLPDQRFTTEPGPGR